MSNFEMKSKSAVFKLNINLHFLEQGHKTSMLAKLAKNRLQCQPLHLPDFYFASKSLFAHEQCSV